ncbi:hypothetical protein CsatA_002983 [Cannabis sativa]
MKLLRSARFPLAVKSMAGLLRYLRRHILQSDVWELPNCRDIVLALWLSYRFLPPLKPCFSCLSIFTRDYEFGDVDRKRLILICMAEGHLQPQICIVFEVLYYDLLLYLVVKFRE